VDISGSTWLLYYSCAQFLQGRPPKVLFLCDFYIWWNEFRISVSDILLPEFASLPMTSRVQGLQDLQLSISSALLPALQLLYLRLKKWMAGFQLRYMNLYLFVQSLRLRTSSWLFQKGQVHPGGAPSIDRSIAVDISLEVRCHISWNGAIDQPGQHSAQTLKKRYLCYLCHSLPWKILSNKRPLSF